MGEYSVEEHAAKTDLCSHGLFFCFVYLHTRFPSTLIQAEWLAAQQDERAMAGLEDEDEEGVGFFNDTLTQSIPSPRMEAS